MTSTAIDLTAETEVLRESAGAFRIFNGQSGECFQLNDDERFKLQLLRESSSVEDAVAAYQSRKGDGWSTQEADAFVAQLRNLGLADFGKTIAEPDADLVPDIEFPPLGDPLSWRNQGGFVNSCFDMLVLLFGWILHPIWTLVISGLVILAVNIVARHGLQMIGEFHDFVSSRPIVIYVGFFVIPKLFLLSLLQGVLAGMACRRFGGRVSEADVKFHFGVFPLFRTQMRDSFFLMSKRGRTTYAMVGLWSVLAVGSLAVLTWKMSTPAADSLRVLCLLLIPPCIIRLFIQCNIYNKVSAAYLTLCEWIGDYHLFDAARAEFRYATSFKKSPHEMTDGKRFWYRAFGLGYILYRVGCVLLLFVGVYLAFAAFSRDRMPVWIVEFVLIGIAMLGSWNRSEKKENRFYV